jgi:RNA polymerase-binding transcription factor DksA
MSGAEGVMERSEAVELLSGERARLERELSEVRGGMARDAAAYDEREANIGPPADRADGVIERSIDVVVEDQFTRELAEITRALDRIENGTYGVCEVCGDLIPDERLRAVPWARRCVKD